MRQEYNEPEIKSHNNNKKHLAFKEIILKKIHAIVNNLAKLVEDHAGVAHLLFNKKRFEGWIQVEVVRLMSEMGIKEIHLENTNHSGTGYYDISFYDKSMHRWAIELKVLTNNNLSWDPLDSTPGPMKRVYEDADNLNLDVNVNHKVLLFLAYPVSNKSTRWLTKLQGLNARGYREICQREFIVNFSNRRIIGLIYAFANQINHA